MLKARDPRRGSRRTASPRWTWSKPVNSGDAQREGDDRDQQREAARLRAALVAEEQRQRAAERSAARSAGSAGAKSRTSSASLSYSAAHPRQHRQQHDEAEDHGEGVVVEVAGLQAAQPARRSGRRPRPSRRRSRRRSGRRRRRVEAQLAEAAGRRRRKPLIHRSSKPYLFSRMRTGSAKTLARALGHGRVEQVQIRSPARSRRAPARTAGAVQAVQRHRRARRGIPRPAPPSRHARSCCDRADEDRLPS